MKIVVVGNYGGTNYGDEVILAGILKSLENLHIQRKDITVLSSNTQHTKKWHKVNAAFYTHILNRKFLKINPAHILHTLKNSATIIIGGGTLLEDKNPHALIHYLPPLMLGKLLHKRVILFAIGVENLKTTINKELVRQACNLSDAIYVRDKNSASILQNLGVTSPINITVDPATTIMCQEPKSTHELPKKEDQGPAKFKIGISLRECPWNPRLTENAQQFVNYAVQKIVERKEKIEVTFFCSENDSQTLHKIIPTLKENKIPYTIMPTHSHNPLTITHLITTMDLIISMRLHPIITARTNGTPCIALAYMDKVENYCKEEKIPYIQLENIEPTKLERTHKKLFEKQLTKNKQSQLTIQEFNSLLLKDNLHKSLTEENAKTRTLRNLISLSILMLLSSTIALIMLLKKQKRIQPIYKGG